MKEYANPIVNSAVKIGMSKKEALKLTECNTKLDFDNLIKFHKLENYILSGELKKRS